MVGTLKEKKTEAVALKGDPSAIQERKKKRKNKKEKKTDATEQEAAAAVPVEEVITQEKKTKKSKKSKKSAEEATEVAESNSNEEKSGNRKRKQSQQDQTEEADSSKKKNRKEKKQKKQKTEGSEKKEEESSSTSSSTSTSAKSTPIVAKEVTVEGVEGIDFKPAKSFAESGIPSEFLKACCEDFKNPTPIQANAWPILRAKKDIIGIAATGSGKTLAFLLPALEYIKNLRASKTSKATPPFVLVLAPTRELACQIRDVADGAKQCRINTLCIYGGVAKDDQRRELRKGTEIIVATPGRLLDLMNEGAVSLSNIGYLVLDEADRMLDMGFERDIRKILAEIPKQRQTLMFSATWPTEIQKLAAEFLNKPAKVTIGSADLSANQSVEQIVEVLNDQFVKDGKLQDLLSKHHRDKKNRIIIFALYKKEAARLESMLWKKGFNVVGIHGDMGQHQRTNAINQFREGTVPLLVATDVAARGLDIPDVEFVINYTFPLTVEDYVHRIGRTGRAGKTGTAFTFFTRMEGHLASELVGVLRGANQKVPEALERMVKTTPQRAQKKKEHQMYGAHFKDDSSAAPSAAPTHFRFD